MLYTIGHVPLTVAMVWLYNGNTDTSPRKQQPKPAFRHMHLDADSAASKLLTILTAALRDTAGRHR